MNREEQLRRRIRWLVWLFVAGLVFSGLTALPLEWELNQLVQLLGSDGVSSAAPKSGLMFWLLRVRDGLHATNAEYPFLAYGTDWLAFGHLVIAVAFIGTLRNPVRNAWLFDFGMIACVLVIPWAFVFGAIRGIPVYWRLIDCSFGVLGLIPLWYARKWTRELEKNQTFVGAEVTRL